MTHGLSDETVSSLRSVFAAFAQVEEVLLYGSRAIGNFRPGSDIDLALKGHDLSLDIMNKIRLQIENLLLPYIVDLSVYNQIGNRDLIAHINRVGITFYKKSG
jgi:predicted nucleotidyltransferase